MRALKGRSHLVDNHPPLLELNSDGIGRRRGDELVEVRRDVDTGPLGVVEGTLANEVRNGVGNVLDALLEEVIGLLADLLLEQLDDLGEGLLLVLGRLGKVVDGGNGGTLRGSLDGLLGRDGESADLGEGGRLDDALDSGQDGGGVKGGEVLGANELEQVGDEDDL